MTADAAVSRRNKANKRKGAQMEADVREYLRSLGFDTEPLKLSGAQDEGDLVIRLNGRQYVVVEAKNEAAMNFSGYLNEADAEAENFAAHRPAVDRAQVHPVAIVKARGKGIEESYVAMRAREFVKLLAVIGK